MSLFSGFRLSFSIFGRFIFKLPGLIGLYAVLIALCFAAYSTWLNLEAAPLLVIAGAFAIFAAVGILLTVHPYLIGTRIGLSMLGQETGNDHGKLLRGAILHGVILGVMTAAATYFVFALIDLGSGLNFAEPSYVYTIDPISDLSVHLTDRSPDTTGTIIALIALAVRAAMLPVFARIVAGNEAGYSLDGIGKNFPKVMLMLLAATVIAATLKPLVLTDTYLLVATTDLLHDANALFSNVASGQFLGFSWANLALFAATVLLSIWLISLQCAVAALTYDDRTQGARLSKVQVFEDRLAMRDEIGELYCNRTQGARG